MISISRQQRTDKRGVYAPGERHVLVFTLIAVGAMAITVIATKTIFWAAVVGLAVIGVCVAIWTLRQPSPIVLVEKGDVIFFERFYMPVRVTRAPLDHITDIRVTGPVDDRTFCLKLEDGTGKEVRLGLRKRQQREVVDFLVAELPRVKGIKIEDPPSFFDQVRGYRD